MTGAELMLRLHAASREAVRLAGEDLMGRAQRDAPVEEGTLRGSARLDMHESPGGVEAEVSFNTVYAARQHEEVTWKHPRGGKAKYLEDNVKAMAPRYAAFIAANVRQALGA